MLLLALLACPPAQETAAPGSDSDLTTETEEPVETDAPCDCDDTLFCNGVETCDDEGACVDGTPPDGDDGDPCTTAEACDEETDSFVQAPVLDTPVCVAPAAVPVSAPGDYAFWYWPGNHRPNETWPAVEREMHFLTGHYGLVMNEETGAIAHFGLLDDEVGVEDALWRENAVLEGLLSATIRFEADEGVIATEFEGTNPSSVDRAQMLDGGGLMNRVQVPTLRYAADEGLTGSLQVASMPRHVVWTHSVDSDRARIVLSGDALVALDTATWLVEGHALSLTDSSGEGWVFIVYDQTGGTTELSWSEGAVVAERVSESGSASISLLAVPTPSVSEDELAVYLTPEDAVRVSSTLLDAEGDAVDASVAAVWDPTLGAYRVDLRPLSDTGVSRWPNWEDPAYHTWYGRHRVDVDTHGVGDLSVPLALHGPDTLSWYITGGVPIVRDLEGVPLGLPVQVSKNWHGEYWYHFYAQPVFTGTDADSFELTIASSSWGEVYAASHAQLSLVGWSDAGGHWDESALGSFGESITYDPDMTLRRSMMDDVRPALVQSDKKWNWTGNVGGADFLMYKDTSWGNVRRLARVRSLYDAPGPNLTDVSYGGVSTDGRIQGQVRTQLVGTDDLVRAYLHLRYTFLEDVEYSRLAFFQMAADNYGDNLFSRFAYGNADGVLFDGSVPDHGTTGYASEDVRGIELSGDEPWVFLYDNQYTTSSLPEQYADIGFVVREYRLQSGNVVVDTPYINIHRTYNGQRSQYGFELSLPDDAWCGEGCEGRSVPAGTVLEATLEYVVPPADKSRYYGESDWLTALPAQGYRSTEMMLAIAEGNARTVEVAIGTLVRSHPVDIRAEVGIVAAEFTLTGGQGYVPVTLVGLDRHTGWQLQVEGDTGWAPFGGDVEGGDAWQTTYDADSGSWSLTFSVPNRQATAYRLVWLP